MQNHTTKVNLEPLIATGVLTYFILLITSRTTSRCARCLVSGTAKCERCAPYHFFSHVSTVGNTTNLLVAGKSLSQTFHANGATRLHPSMSGTHPPHTLSLPFVPTLFLFLFRPHLHAPLGEWTTGVAAGGTAVLMIRNNWGTDVLMDHVSTIQGYLNSTAVGQPLAWAHGPTPPPQVGYTCSGFNLCIGTDNPNVG